MHLAALSTCRRDRDWSGGFTVWQRHAGVVGRIGSIATAAIGAYHTGVERGWWEGPTTCTSGPIGGLSTDELFDQIMSAPLVRCDEVPWELFGLSMASWNMIISLILMGLWIAAARKPD